MAQRLLSCLNHRLGEIALRVKMLVTRGRTKRPRDLHYNLVLVLDTVCVGQVGDQETRTPVWVESLLKYHSDRIGPLTSDRETGPGTVPGGQFNWGGCLPKSNGGAQRFPQPGRQSGVECKCTRELDCETDMSSRDESRDQ
eukprot:TRINITY_DN64192_c1_g1_i2.p2 TRINITY_DN64192_c1_g1~~TRINITY_DN64192_c1_g1_i2.p2  ORF type:complete len:150 (+),score=3.21 TRINITY_DN64192_c1_g1_i2:28-450(+)